MRWKSRTYPVLRATPYLHVGLSILVSFPGKILKVFTILVSPVMEG